MAAIRILFTLLPLIFGIGFLAPLIAQVMAAMGWAAPLAMSPLGFGLAVGAAWGLLATIRGRWI